MAIPTVRIPELSPTSSVSQLSMLDIFPMFVTSLNATVGVPLQQVYQFITTGGTGTTYAPVQSGQTVIYVVPPADAGLDTAAIPSLAGKSFALRSEGYPFIPQTAPTPDPNAEFEILTGGGFKLLNDTLREGQRFELDVYTLASGTTTGGGSTTTGNLFKGAKSINTNASFSPTNDIGYLIQLRGGSSQITYTFPTVADFTVAGTVVMVEALVNNSKQNKLACTGGQYFYLNNTAKDALYLSPGEVVWLFVGSDGFYVINNFGENYRKVGIPQPCWVLMDGMLIYKGQELNRADYPRLWEYASSLGTSLVSESTWQTASVTQAGRTVLKPYRGCFSTGNGTTTFRLPDLMNMALRGLKTETGSDTERYYNKGGGYQRHEYEQHHHTSQTGTRAEVNTDNVGFQPNNYNNIPGDTTDSGGAETRMDNIGVFWAAYY